MDTFVRSVPAHATERSLKDFFRSPLAEFGIHYYEIQKGPSKTFATLTILDSFQAQDFLSTYGQHPNRRPRAPLYFDGSLMLEAARQRSKPALATSGSEERGNERKVIFEITTLSCGVWDYVQDRLAFIRHYHDTRGGELVIGLQKATILLPITDSSSHLVAFNYYDVDHVITGSSISPTITFTLRCAPKSYLKCGSQDAFEALTAMFVSAGLNGHQPANTPGSNDKKVRIRSISEGHQDVVGTCFVYQHCLASPSEVANILSLLRARRKVQAVLTTPTKTFLPAQPLPTSFKVLQHELTGQDKYGGLPFAIRFQLVRLAQNGLLSPLWVLQLLPAAKALLDESGHGATAEAIHRLGNDLHKAGPYTEARLFSQRSFIQLMKSYAQDYASSSADNGYHLANRHLHIKLIHKLIVTPAGTYLEGPDPAVTNRVLRKYKDQEDYFLRVNFVDEDGESMRCDPTASLQEIYHGRFKPFLDGTYIIADRGFSFLGFSHSSLRSQACWFMASFISVDRELMLALLVIRRLGDFSSIRSPAKCAARIGQAFTDNTGTVEVPVHMLQTLQEVERNERVFSDGCGRISLSMAKVIWRLHATSRALKPTIFQIRYAGAKGVVSIDTRLSEKQLNLRKSMIKFEGSSDVMLEICGAAFRPLPMVLNRQFIKIFEDLGVPSESFLRLQTMAMQRLQMMTRNGVNAAAFLKEGATSKAARLPSLIMSLSDIGLNFQDDPFMRDIVEMAVVTKLREMKYRGRIPVANGMTLYGIMDKTGFLKEGEVYVTTESAPQGGKQTLVGEHIIITRSPALHPGDIRLVSAVDVPADSLLNSLANCVVFSQHGDSDLPSQLSGGDLDGDIYNILFEPSLMPRRSIAEPADYPRPEAIDIGRDVTAKDMPNFFVSFLENDRLGQISTTHMQLADQKPEGTFDPDCIKLAGMASTAVDFSKSGLQVDMSQCPKYPRYRPDFMAPSPRVFVDKGGIEVMDGDDSDDEEEEPSELDAAPRRMRFYESQKALGHLYRAIDERRFLADMKRDRKTITLGTEDKMISDLWDYVQRSNLLVQWEHNQSLAHSIRGGYEHNLIKTLTAYAPSQHAALTEHELFSGTILGRANGASNKHLKELTNTMRERFEEILEFTVARIVQGDGDSGDRNEEALPRAIACLAIGMREEGMRERKVGAVKSWRYVAAGVVLREMRRWGVGGLGLLPAFDGDWTVYGAA